MMEIKSEVNQKFQKKLRRIFNHLEKQKNKANIMSNVTQKIFKYKIIL